VCVCVCVYVCVLISRLSDLLPCTNAIPTNTTSTLTLVSDNEVWSCSDDTRRIVWAMDGLEMGELPRIGEPDKVFSCVSLGNAVWSGDRSSFVTQYNLQRDAKKHSRHPQRPMVPVLPSFQTGTCVFEEVVAVHAGCVCTLRVFRALDALFLSLLSLSLSVCLSINQSVRDSPLASF
jgi:hypothetical protein